MEHDWDKYIRNNLRYDPQTGLLWWTCVGKKRNFEKPAGNKHKTQGHIQVRLCIKGVCKVFKAHRICWFIYYGDWPIKDLDHKNNDRSDNRLENLRLATVSENMMNKSKSKGKTSRYKGVSRRSRDARWKAAATLNYKQVHLGYFDTEEEAALAYDRCAKQLFGNYAKINFPETDTN
jgi:hypothetical protein